MSRSADGPAQLRRCDLCGIRHGALQRGRPARILRFSLVYFVVVAGRNTSRSVGSLLLCSSCWEAGPAKRRRPGSGRPRKIQQAIEVGPPEVGSARAHVEALA